MKKIVILILTILPNIYSEECVEKLELFVAFDLIPAIGANLYQHTYALTSRPIFTLPALNNNINSRDNCSGFSFNLFYNSTPGLYTTKIEDNLNDYIQIAGSDILDELSADIIEGLENNIPLTLLDEFENANIHEHRVGALISANCRFFDCFRFEIGIPIVYQLRHYNIPEESLLEIKRFRLFDQSGGDESSVYKYVVGDSIGFDDSFCRIGWIYDSRCTQVETGVLGIIPTGTAWKTGLIGQDFRNSCPPFVDYGELLLVFADKQEYVKEILQEVGIQAAYRLSAMTLNQPLGEESKGGLGIYQRGSYILEKNCFLEWLAQGAYLFKRSATRYYIVKKDPKLYETSIYKELLQEYEEDPTPELLAEICESVRFLNQSIANTLFPDPLEVCLHPQWWYQLQLIANARYECWGAQFGFDWWHRQKPKIGLSASDTLKYNIPEGTVCFNQYQLKLVAGIGGCFCKTWGDVDVWLKFDQTMINQGIGQDRTINLQVNVNF